MKHEITMLLVAGLAIAAGSSGVSTQDNRTIYGAGTNTCSQWTESRTGEGWFTAGQWVLGFVSAANRYSKTPPTKSDARSMARWVDDYCRDHADRDVADAAEALVEALMTAKLP
jgi:hypothetical protein